MRHAEAVTIPFPFLQVIAEWEEQHVRLESVERILSRLVAADLSPTERTDLIAEARTLLGIEGRAAGSETRASL